MSGYTATEKTASTPATAGRTDIENDGFNTPCHESEWCVFRTVLTRSGERVELSGTKLEVADGLWDFVLASLDVPARASR